MKERTNVMSENRQNALYQELIAAALRCESSLWLCKTCQEVVFYDRRLQEPLGSHDSHQAVPIPTLFDQDEGCERGFLRGWVESEATLSEERRAHLLKALAQSPLGAEEFLAEELGGDEREIYERYRSDEAEAIVMQLL
jgi:hypothetical protein